MQRPCGPMNAHWPYGDEMRRIYRSSGGHAPWTETETSAVAFLSGSDVRGYRIIPSIGCEGAVWARGLVISPVSH